jgi:hypothetical protein
MGAPPRRFPLFAAPTQRIGLDASQEVIKIDGLVATTGAPPVIVSGECRVIASSAFSSHNMWFQSLDATQLPVL